MLNQENAVLSQMQQPADTVGMATPTPNNIPDPVQVKNDQPKQNNFLVVLLSVLLLISVVIAGFFAYQTQVLVKELNNLKTNQKSTSIITTESKIEPTATNSAMTVDPTAGWKTYIDPNGEFNFKYPTSSKLDNSQKNLTKISFMGQKQIDSGRTQTELFDGYAFMVADVTSEGVSLDQIFEKRKESFLNACDAKNISAKSKIKIDNKEAIFYSTSCLGEFSNYIVSANRKFYEINILTSGDTEDLPKYKDITNQTLSTFKFVN
jgi:hypothetical protein